MNLPYILRLVFLSLASFFLVHGTLGLAARLLAPSAIRLAEKIRPRSAAHLLLALRLLPAGLASFLVIALCVPSYLWFEPDAAAERIGLACSIAALLGAALWVFSVARVLRAAARSLRYTRRCMETGRTTRVPGEVSSVLLIEGKLPVLALAGVVDPRVVISRSVMSALSAEQLAAALHHERAHQISRDNLKRLFLLLAPDIFPFSRGLAALERAWARFSEWAADDLAVQGDSQRSLSLAAALVRVAQMGIAPRAPAFLMSLVADGRDLSARVDRLLRANTQQDAPSRKTRFVLGGAALAIAALVVAAMLQPATFYSVHWLLEHLIR